MNRALVVIDVQESFRVLPSWQQISAPDIAERCARLVARARHQGDLVVWVLHTDPGSGTPFDPASGCVALLPGLTPTADDVQVLKTSHNAFTTTNLQQQLVRRGITGLRLAGIRTEQCVETTARLASDLGHDVEVVIDATATHPLPLADGSGVLSAEQVVARTAAALQGRFARIVTLDRAVAS